MHKIEGQQILMKLRIEQAHECLDSASREVVAESYRAAANRSYFCIFHSIRALLALHDYDSKKHKGIITKFREIYIKTEIFPLEFSDIIKQAFSNRGESDIMIFLLCLKKKR